jgi:hypothetical protein
MTADLLLSLPLPAGFGVAIDLTTGECKKQVGPNQYEFDELDALTNSYHLRRAAGNLLSPHRKLLASGKSVPAYRTVRCGSYLHSQEKGVDFWKTPDAKRAHFGGLVTCGSQWLCAVCSLKIALSRRGEAQLAVQKLGEQGGVCGLLTLTIPHQIGQSFDLVFGSLNRLYSLFSSGGQSAKFRKLWGQLGYIRAVEVTRGINGWHPHFHIVLFFAKSVLWAELTNDFFARWHKIAKKEFSWNLPRASLDLRGHGRAAEYISKWSIEDEITMAHVKKGRGESLTPFELLSAYSNGDSQAGRDWHEFAVGVSPLKEGRVKSANRLTWSPGLKGLLSIKELTDEQIADAQDKRAHLLGTLTFDQWQKVLAQEFDVRPALLTLATQGNFQDVENFVNKLPGPQA